MEKKVEPEIFRSVISDKSQVDRRLKTNSFVRPPTRVSCVVDNLWEWARSEKYPSRRSSAFASPRVDIAKDQGPQDGKVYRVEFFGKYKICQIKGYRNAIYHPDCRTLPAMLFEKLGNDWLRLTVDAKFDIGRLWLPVLKKDETEKIFEEIPFFASHRDEILSSIRFWKDVQLINNENPVIDNEGELFFEAADGYYLRSL